MNSVDDNDVQTEDLPFLQSKQDAILKKNSVFPFYVAFICFIFTLICIGLYICLPSPDSSSTLQPPSQPDLPLQNTEVSGLTFPSEFLPEIDPNSRGIILCGYPKILEDLKRTLRMIRVVFHISLPIEIYHFNEFTSETHFDQYSDVNIISLNESYKDLGGFICKPLALATTRFENVILMDLDIYFLQSPLILFTHPIYQSTGTLYFRDRLIDKYKTRFNLIHEILKPYENDIPKVIAKSWIWRGRARDFQESGVLAINKRVQRKMIHAMLSMLFDERLMEDIKRELYGDKELYWIAGVIAQTPIGFSEFQSSALGKMNTKQNEICGMIAHWISEGDIPQLFFLHGHEMKKLFSQRGGELAHVSPPIRAPKGKMTNWFQGRCLPHEFEGTPSKQLDKSEIEIMKQLL